jgi:hypothetical protein
LIIDSAPVAMGYTAKFEEYWSGKFALMRQGSQ